LEKLKKKAATNGQPIKWKSRPKMDRTFQRN